MRVIRGIFVCLAVFSICFSFISGQATKNINPGFDFSGIERFWEIVDVLEQDQEPAAAQWDALFETPGYAEILRHEFSRNYFQDTITAVFMPSKESLAEEIIQKHKEAGGFYSWYTPGVIKGYRQAKKDRKWIEARIQELDKHTPFLLLMAHEAFHLYRDQKLEFVEPPGNSPDKAVIWVLNQVENEGIGDLINRKILYFKDGCLKNTEQALKYQKEQLAQPAILRIMDAILREMAEDPEIASQLGGTLRGVVPKSGHPTGFYMANVIVDEFGTQAVVDVARNPFKFFYLYNEAAKTNGKVPVFSKKAISYIKKLEAKYTKSEQDI